MTSARLWPLALLGLVGAVGSGCTLNRAPIVGDDIGSRDGGMDASRDAPMADVPRLDVPLDVPPLDVRPLDVPPPLDLGMLDAGVDATDIGMLDGGVDSGEPDTGVDAGMPDTGVDAGMPDTGVDAGMPDTGVDAGMPDTGVDAGMPDTGVDSGIPDTGVDAGPPPLRSCDAIYGGVRDYQSCNETATTCEFYVRLDGSNCNALCTSLGAGNASACYFNGAVVLCNRLGGDGCGNGRFDALCICARIP